MVTDKRKRKPRKRGSSRLAKLLQATTSSSSQASPPPHVVAGKGDGNGVQSATSPTTSTERKQRSMTDQEELGSIVEYAEDLADAEAPEPLPPSEYEAEIRLAEAKISNSSGKKYAAVSFYISTDQFPPDYDVINNPDGVTIIYRRVPLEDNPRARWAAKRFIEAIGAKPGKRIDLNDWVGLTATVGVVTESYEGSDREVITKVTAV